MSPSESQTAPSTAHMLIPFPPLSAQPTWGERFVERDGDTPIAGFSFGGVHAGVKSDPAKLDFGLISVPSGARCAGVYTQNQVVAAPVTLSRAHLATAEVTRAVIVNSGNANACTGERGVADALHLAEQAARLCGCAVSEVQVASTGVIGAPLPIERLDAATSSLGEDCSSDGLRRFATSIMTTDNRPKVRVLSLDLRGVEGAAGVTEVQLGGCSKGAGMIHPNMATMLAYLCSDAPISQSDLQAIWRRVCDQSFNAITIDGDTSTNDTALCLTSGLAPRDEEALGPVSDLSGDALALFERALLTVAQALAVDILRDGEGVEHIAALTIHGARDRAEARQVAETIGLSPLVKTAMNGCDPNWGRIVAAIGRSGVSIEPERISLKIGGVSIYERGVWRGVEREREASAVMRGAEYSVDVNLELGDASFTLFMSDLSAQYVSINADYRS